MLVLAAVTWSVGTLAWWFPCVLFGGGPLCLLPYLVVLAAACTCVHEHISRSLGPNGPLVPLPYLAFLVLARVWAYLLLFLCSRACCVSVLWRWLPPLF